MRYAFALLLALGLACASNAAPAFKAALFAIPTELPWRYHLACVVANAGEEPVKVRVTPQLVAEANPASRLLELERDKVATASFEISVPPEALSKLVRVSCNAPGQSEQLKLRLTSLASLAGAWQVKFVGEDASLGYAAEDASLEGFQPRVVPYTLEDVGYTWLRREVVIPEGWAGKPLVLHMAQVDDNDATFFNGQKIGETGGWDTPRNYVIPPDLIRYGEANLVAVRVHNTAWGGGLYKLPLYIAPEEVISRDLAKGLALTDYAPKPAPRPAPGAVGPALPMRPIFEEEGVLYYMEGQEVALWGTNYYPMAWGQYTNMQARGADFHKAIVEDLDMMQQMGIEALRLHLFDTEMSDAEGNLIDNEHLELLDFLIAECNRRSIYFVMTTMAWWGSPSQRPDAFSVLHPKEALLWGAEAKAAEKNYLNQLLTHVNRYTGNPYAKEPCIACYELLNEPAYYSYGQVTSGAEEREITELRQLYADWLEAHSLPDNAMAYDAFSCELAASWANGNLRVLREAGARQPAGVAYFAAHTVEGLHLGFYLSRAQLFTTGRYIGSSEGWKGHDTTADNYMASYNADSFPEALDGLARIVYEFDAISTSRSYMYPPFAAMWRDAEVQIATQFQYDTLVTADRNSDWNIHYLNFWYTPRKAVSFLIASDVFSDLPRGAPFAPEPMGNILPELGVAFSFEHDVSIEARPDVYRQSAPTDWRPLPIPTAPREIMAVGNCPYWQYDGTGLVQLKTSAEGATLVITPNVTEHYPSGEYWHEGMTRTLDWEPKTLRLKLPGYQEARLIAADGAVLQLVEGAIELKPGVYKLERAAR